MEDLFIKYAQEFLNNTILIAKDKKYRICEVEMYYHSKEHPDEYTHKDPLQLEFDQFYPHRFRGKGYKAGTYKCMDIVRGDKEKDIYFGILIRSIQNIETKEFFTGPCVSVNELLKNYNCTEFKDFFSKHSIDEFQFKEMKHPIEDIYVGPRVGLGDKYPDYKMRNYRYAIMIKQIKKQKKFSKLK